MFTCVSCDLQHTDGPICSVCKNQYDFACAGVTENGYRRLGERKNMWRCPKCKSSPLPSPITTSPMQSQLDKMQEQLNQIVSQLNSLTSVADDIKSIKSDVNNLKDSLEMAYGLISNFSSSIKTLEDRVTSVEKLTSEIPTIKAEISRLNRDLEDRDQWARANNVEIRGLPQKNAENLFEVALKVGSLCNFPIKKEDINYIARVPTLVPNTPKPIIIAFNNRYIKEELVASARKSKQLTLDNMGFSSLGNFYVNDHLTQRNKQLLRKARSLAKERNFQYIWVKHSKIMARKSDSSPIFFIKREEDLTRIV